MIWCALETHHIETSAETRPSLLRYSPALILLVIAIADIQRWADPDLWGHVAFGRAMLATHHLALHDPYSYSAPGHLWLNHEWLSELLMGGIYNLGGVVGLKLMKFACCAAVIVALALGLAETDSPMTVQLLVMLVAGVSIAPQIQFRPQLFTFVMLAGLLALLTRFTYRGKAPLPFAIPMMWIWANLHGGFIIGLAALAIFSAVRVTTDLIGGRGPWVGAKLFAILAVSTLVTLANPYGPGGWQAVAHAITNPRTREVIEDWQPLLSSLWATWRQNHVAALPDIVAIAMFVALAVTWILNPRCGDLAIAAVALAMIVAAVIAMRNVPLAVLATGIVLAQHSSRFFEHAQPYYWSRLSQFILVAAGVTIMTASGLLSARMRAGSPKPVGAISFMQAHRLSGNLLSGFAWGEYLIWHESPESKVFMDGRYDTVYPPDVIEDYLAFDLGAADAQEVLRKYPHDFVLLRTNDVAALAVIGATRYWTRIYRDGSCVLFARSDSTAAKIPAVEVPAQLTPHSYFP
jgi:hypothetical protein